MARGKKPPAWPPDAFALAGSILHRSGGYQTVVDSWPVDRAKEDWIGWIEDVGRRWRQGWPNVPGEVAGWWQQVVGRRRLPLAEVPGDRELCRALICLCAAADVACAGVGVFVSWTPGDQTGARRGVAADDLWWEANKKLMVSANAPKLGATLCDPPTVDPWKVRVLPKFHTPQTGMTLRSLSHHLALCPSEEVVPCWSMLPPGLHPRLQSNRRMINLLLAPWPMRIQRNQFAPSSPARGNLRTMPDRFRFFSFSKPSDPTGVVDRLNRLYEAAIAEAGAVDLVVLPELALDPAEYEKVRAWAQDQGVFLVSGVG
ncbi:MAG: hypothetical protein D6696_13505, partial [Acidobacteria bacterium]